MSDQDNALEVWLDCDLGPACQVGTLAHDRGQVRFRYNRNWLKDARAFALDPDLSLDEQPFFPKPELGNFGIFLDSSPDRWGQTLMKRREALQAKDEQRTPRTLYAWDFLIGVQDLTRQGALRFRRAGTEDFLGNQNMAAPPITTLRELEAVAYQLSSRRIDDLDALRKWLAVLVAPGASLGGARPKANFTETDGSLWIGKFPARDDDRDVGAWEYVVHGLATKARIDVPVAKLIRLNSDHRTFCVQRFDRVKGARRFYDRILKANVSNKPGSPRRYGNICAIRSWNSWQAAYMAQHECGQLEPAMGRLEKWPVVPRRGVNQAGWHLSCGNARQHFPNRRKYVSASRS